MEPKGFSKQELIDMIKNYYIEVEDKNVNVDIWSGNIVSSDKSLSTMGVVQFDVYEAVPAEENRVAKFPIDFDDDDLKKIVSYSLEKTGFRVESVSYTVLPNNPKVFTGIQVSGEKINESEKKI